MAAVDGRPVETTGWVGRPWAARVVWAVAALAPLPAPLLSSYVVSHLWSRPNTLGPIAGWWLTLLGVAVVVSIAVDRAARRLLPLATLLRLSLIFPDETPSRFRVALRSGNAKLLETRLADLGRSELPGGSSEVAALLLELVTALGTHDRMTRGHSERVRAYSTVIGEELGLDADSRNKLQWAALLHDVGKMAVPADLLNKVEPLTDDEFATIRHHPAAAERLLDPLAGWLGDWRLAATQHHERFDGKGYPNRLDGSQITLAGRIVAVADSFDVMTTARSYKKPQSHETARQELTRCAGSQFDPAIVRAFLAVSIGSHRRRILPLAWLAQLSYLRPAVTSTLALTTGMTGAALGFAIAPASAASVPTSAAATTSVSAAAPNAPAPNVSTPSTRSTVPAADDRPARTFTSTATTLVATPAATAPPTTTTVAPTPPDTVEPPPTSTVPTTAVANVAPSTTVDPGPAIVVATTVPPPPPSTTATGPPTPCELLQAGQTKLPAADLAGCDARGLTLTGADLTAADLTGADLRNATIDRASFNGARLANADLRGAHLTGTGFQNADLSGARLDGVWADQVGFAGANLRGARLSGMFLSRGNMNAADLTGASADHLVFGGVDLYDTILTNAIVDHSNLSGAHLDRAVFDHADLSNSDLRGASVKSTRFTGTNLAGVNLSGATGTPASAVGAIWSGATCASGLLVLLGCY